MLWRVDQRGSQPLYEQISGAVRLAVGERTLRPGARLPAAKELAASLDVNLHTVLSAYQALRDDGLIELRRGRGAVVIASDIGVARLNTLVDDLVAHAQSLGIGRAELSNLIKRENLDD